MVTDDEISEDEEEILAYVEFEGLVDGNVFSEKQLQLDMIGIDTEHPVMQINGKFYEGTYEDVIGTYMLFAKLENSVVDDPVFDVAPYFKYFAKTRKVLKMQRIFVKSRTEVLGDSEHDQSIPNLNTLKQAGIPFWYQEKALSFWTIMRNNRLNELCLYLEKQRIRQQKKSQGIILESDSDEDNPFAIYKHKEEFIKLHNSENFDVPSEMKSNCFNNHITSKLLCSSEINTDENSDTKKYMNSKIQDCYLMESVKDHKTTVSSNEKINIGHNEKQIKSKVQHILFKDRVSSFDKKKGKLSNFEKESVEWDASSVNESFNSSEFIGNETIGESSKRKITGIENIE